MKKLVHNVETNEISEVDLSAAEISEIEKERLEMQTKAEEEARVKAEAAAAKAALLAKLGITEEEAKLLLS